MENKTLKWHYSETKFKQVMAHKEIFREVLGRVFNTTWELEIAIDCFEKKVPTLDFYLNGNPSDGRINIFIRVIRKTTMIINRYFSFLSGFSSQFLCSYKTTDIDDYNLDFFFIFDDDAAKNINYANEFEIENLAHLSTSLHDMFQKEHMTDVVLKCDDLVSVKAHKNILSAQSPVFEAIFTSLMLEREQDIVVIKDIDPSVFHAMISFMYSGRVKVESETMACDLLYAAEKYQIEALKKGCIEYLKSVLSLENSIKVLEISNLFDKQLKLYCLDYVKKQFKEIKSTKEWRDLKLKNPVLALEVYSCTETD